MAGTWTDLIALGRRLKAAGYTVGENPQFGGVAPGVHAKGSAHYTKRGDALDINFDGRGQAFETAKLQAIVPQAKALGLRVIWQTAGHYDHIHIDDFPGPDIGRIGSTTPSTKAGAIPAAPPAAVVENVGLGPSLDELAGTVTKAVLISVAVLAGAGLVVLGANKITDTKK